MAKRASLSAGLSGIAKQKPGTDPAPTVAPDPVSEVKAGRPRVLPSGYKTFTMKLSPETHHALNVLAAEQGTTAKKIILDGLADQFTRYGVSAAVV